eukprot:1630056-Prymnesium_polylepis.1
MRAKCAQQRLSSTRAQGEINEWLLLSLPRLPSCSAIACACACACGNLLECGAVRLSAAVC